MLVREIGCSGPNQYFVLRGPPNYCKRSVHRKSLIITDLIHRFRGGPWRGSRAVFPNLFLCSRHPYLVFKVFGGTPGKFNRYKDITAPLALAHGTLVGNHWSAGSVKITK